MEMLSPRHSHGFANGTDLVNYDRVGSNLNYTQKVPGSAAGGPRGAPVKVPAQGNHPIVINPSEINYAQGTGSKDKRLTMFPDHIKKFVIDSNKEKALKKDLETKRNQDIKTMVGHSSSSYANTKQNLASISTINSYLMHQQQNQNNTHAEPGTEQVKLGPNNLLETQPVARGGTAVPGQRNKINMDAYHAYYNTNESSNNPLSSQNGRSPRPLSEHQFGATQPVKPATAGEKSPEKQINVGKTNTAPGSAGENAASPTTAATGPNGATNIVNNIMHINSSGANINITSMPNCQNNFIFNHTAPINLNFYNKNTKKVVPGQTPTAAEKAEALTDPKRPQIEAKGDALKNYDSEIVSKLQQKGYSLQIIKDSLKDPNSGISAQYQKLINEKLDN